MNKNFSIFGDSISTFEGSNPDNYNVFYNSEMKIRTGIARETDTWWGRVIDYFDGKLLVNNSWSGSRVTKYPDAVSDFPSGISLTRINSLSANGVLPDIIIVYLGTNDWGFGVPLRKTNDITDRKSCFDGIMQKLMCKAKNASAKMCLRVKDIITNTDGDQITGWLIVVLLVVVVGAFFLSTYKTTITEVWDAIVDKIYATFGI